MKFQIKNNDTGEVQDIRQYKEKNNNQKITSNAWVDWWQKKKKHNKEFLEYAQANQLDQCFQLLDKKLADLRPDVNTKNQDNGFTALHYASLNNNVNLVSHLLFHEAIIDALSNQQQTPLMISCKNQNIDIVQILITAGADINIQDVEKNTPFHYACMTGNQKLLQIFLKKPSLNYQVENIYGKTAFDLIHNSNLKETLLSQLNIQQQNQQKIKIIEINKKTNGIIFQKGSLESLQQKLSSISTNTNLSDDKINSNKFIIYGMIGKGSFGEVYLVQKIDNGQLYAMKVLHKSKILNNNLTRYALTERNILSTIKHPFIVKLVYAFQNSEKLFLILNYCPGGDLGELLQKEKQLSESRVINYAAEIVLALEHLHSKDIIFRDLKPDNIVIDNEGHALLTDFGLSKEGVLEHASGAKSFCGSVAYLAPEMLKKCGHGKAVDWYLLGVVIYELLVGIPPYYSNNKEELFYNIQNAQLKLPEFLSIEAKSLLKALLQRNPLKRLGSGKCDADEIKLHPFFKKIDWKEVQQRKLKHVLPNRKLRINTNFNENILEENIDENEQQYISGWSFIDNSEQYKI